MHLKAQGPAAYLYGSKRISDAKGEQDIPYIIGLCFTACAGEGENRGNILWESPGNGFTDYGLHHTYCRETGEAARPWEPRTSHGITLAHSPECQAAVDQGTLLLPSQIAGLPLVMALPVPEGT